MFKLVVLCAFVAASVAEPEPQLLYPGLVSPYTSYSTVVSPASTSISSQSSSVIHPSPITYGASLAFPHFIKKRSADPQFITPAFNAAYNYYPTSYLSSAAVPLVQTPITTYSSAGLPLGSSFAHLIKKRSADPQFIAPSYYPTTYVSNAAISTPVVSSPYLASPYYSSASLPLLNAHLIKKRSAQFLPSYPYASTYINTIPTSPYVTSPVVTSSVYSSPVASYPIATHLIKKRSADPQLLASVPGAATYYSGSPFYPYAPAATTLIRSSPIISANPFVYSTFIKK